jgi:hypothetical protein
MSQRAIYIFTAVQRVIAFLCYVIGSVIAGDND